MRTLNCTGIEILRDSNAFKRCDAKARSFREVQITRDKYGNFVTVDQLGREVLLAVPARQPPEETNNAKSFCEALYGNVKVWKTK